MAGHGWSWTWLGATQRLDMAEGHQVRARQVREMEMKLEEEVKKRVKAPK